MTQPIQSLPFVDQTGRINCHHQLEVDSSLPQDPARLVGNMVSLHGLTGMVSLATAAMNSEAGTALSAGPTALRALRPSARALSAMGAGLSTPPSGPTAGLPSALAASTSVRAQETSGREGGRVMRPAPSAGAVAGGVMRSAPSARSPIRRPRPPPSEPRRPPVGSRAGS
jgi:hypothetical protein